MDDLFIDNLAVIHRAKDSAGHGLPRAQAACLSAQGLYIDTCLRQLVIIDAAAADPPPRLSDPELQWFRNCDAYSFLLQTATGLNSSIPGETNILGQFQHAWRSWRTRTSSGQARKLDAIMQLLFRDSRDIRQQYLQGIGGNSYGSLVRKLLAPDADARILFVGAGKLAHSMHPLFAAYEVAFWNHRATDSSGNHNQHTFASDAPHLAVGWATHIVLTTPADTETDTLWSQLINDAQTVVHMGRRRAEPGTWSDVAMTDRYYDLDDVFELRSRQSSVRSLQILRARKACEQIARNRIGDSPLAEPRKATA